MINENKLDMNKRTRNFLFLIILVVISISVRLFFLPFETPFKTDAIDYFSFALETSKTFEFPNGILKTNDGWSLFLSPIFSIVGNSDMMSLVNAQRITSIVISSLTIIPIFYLCKKFVLPKYALIGAGLFGFSHRLMENSILGLTESLFIFLITCVLFFSLSKNSKSYFMSFSLLALASIVRYEALVFLIPLVIIFFIRFRKIKKSYLKLPLFILIFILILLPVATLRLESNNSDGLISHTIGNPNITNPNTYSSVAGPDIMNESNQSQNSFMLNSFFNTFKFLGLISIPLFAFFLPTGIYRLIKTKNTDLFYLLIFSVFMIIPAMYAYGREIQDTRYLFVLFPFFCVISVYGLDVTKKFQKNNYIIIVLAVIIVSSIFLLNLEQSDFLYNSEIYQITKKIVEDANGVNGYSGSSYVKIATLEKMWPNSLPLNEEGKVSSNLKIIPTDNFDTIEEYIIKSQDSGLTHIILTKNNGSLFLDKLASDYNQYSYLEKIYDSQDHDFENEIIILKINYMDFKNKKI